MKIKNKYSISVLKANTLKLRGTHQLPTYLVYLILQIDNDTPIEVIELLKNFSIHMLRVKDYYKKYPQINEEYNEEIKKSFETH